MRYAKTVELKGGVELLVRNAVASDARALRETTQLTHAETDYLLSYPDEQSSDDEQEARSLEETERSIHKARNLGVHCLVHWNSYGFSDRVMDWGAASNACPIASGRCTPYLRTTLMRWPTWLPDSISSSIATAKSA